MIRNIILSLDIFSFGPTLLIDKKSQLSTIPGSFCTICIFLIFCITMFFSDFFQKKSPKVFSLSFKNQETTAIKFSKEKFPIFLILVDSYGTPFNDLGIFHFKADQIVFEKKLSLNDPNIALKERTMIQLNKCQQEDFLPFNILQKEELDFSANYLNYTCFENKELFLEGDFDEKFINQILITLNVCNNLTSNFTCKSPEEIYKFFMSPKKVVFGYVGFNEDVENFDNPLVNSTAYETYEIDYNKPRKELISLKKTLLKTKSDFFDEKNSFSIKLDEKKSEFFDFLSESDSLVSITLQASKRYEKITRTYQSIGEALASSFSLIKILIIVIKVFMWYINKIKIKLYLVNNLYNFDIQDGENDFEKAKKNKENHKLKKKKGNTMKGCSLKFSLFQAFVAEVKNNYFKKWTSHKEKLYIESENIFTRDTNLTYIIKKLHELEKIKFLIFNEKQRFIFNFFTKPMVYLPNCQKNDAPNKKLSDSLNFGEQSLIKMEECKQNLSEIIKSMTYSEKDIDQKLLIYLDERMDFKKDKTCNFRNCEMLNTEWRRFTIS